VNKQLKVVLVIMLIGFGYAGYEFYDFYATDVPVMEKARVQKEQELAKQEVQLKKLQDFAQNIESIKQELRELNLQLETALEHMPRSFNLSGLLRKLTMLAQNSGLDLSTFRPGKDEVKTEGAFYVATTINFELQGSFTEILTFLDQVARLKRIISIDHLDLSTRSVAGSEGKPGGVSLVTTAVARTYRFAD